MRFDHEDDMDESTYAVAELVAIREELEGKMPTARLPGSVETVSSVEVKDCWCDVAEIYSPPRVTEEARRMHLRAGFALDLTTFDSQGWRYDFSQEEMRSEA